ncbi:MAG: tetratricopeptide repeat protein, partial [Rhodothermales bacterium]|nr:tetratricopeptide repeat protein [Rhodothermales bacterium]
YVQEEYRLDAQGQKTHRLVRTIDYVVGSGSAARTYLTEEGGRYYELPLTWYTQVEGGAGRWDFSPGYRESNGRFDRAIPARCMACHNGNSEPVPFTEGKYVSIDDGIGCEQCHGPGARHVEERLVDEEADGDVDPTIVNPAHLSLDRRLAVCQQCHLNGTVSLLREGRGAYSFRPGEPLASHVALFNLDAEDAGTIAVISHADRMKMSPCFIESAAMDCTTCHDPHEGFRQAGPDYFNQTCIGCHATEPLQAEVPAALRAEHQAGADCFACHMPKVEADDAPHSSFTDHYIRVVEPEGRVTGQLVEAERVELEPYFERDEGAEGEVYEAMAYVVYGRQTGRPDVMREGVARLDAVLTDHPEHGEAQYLRGWARLQLGEAAQAIPALEEAVRLGPDVPERLNALAQAYEQARRSPAETERLYRRALEIQPALADVRVNYGRFLQAQGQLDAAIREYRTALDEDPWLAQAHYNLGTALLQRGGGDEAAEHLAEALRLQPDHVDALVNLGIYRATRGETEQAGDLFRRAVAAGPDDPNALANLGTYHLQRGAFVEAQEALRRA